MNFIISANTDIGIKKSTNQDSLTIKHLDTMCGEMVFAVLCDGMGGMEKGEVASASLVQAFNEWVNVQLVDLCNVCLDENILWQQWSSIIQLQNRQIKEYGAKSGIRLGTTAVVLLLTQEKYYLFNIGDSRIYELCNHCLQLTKDQTFIQQETDQGRMTIEQTMLDPRRNVLLQCIGVSDKIYPEFRTGQTKKDAVYMLCSDGFCHEISASEIYANLQPSLLLCKDDMEERSNYLIELNKKRLEQDNISIALIRTY